MLNWLLSNELARMVIGGLVGALIGYVVAELSRVHRKRRLLLGSAMLPTFVLTTKGGEVSLRMIGDYGIVNMSELPISLQRPHLLGYNLASRAFQFKVMPIGIPFERLFQEITVPPNSEMVLVSDKSCKVYIERLRTRSVPGFIWLETFEYVRLGSRKKFHWRSRLYIVKFHSPEKGETWYRPTDVEISSTKARLLALPGKLLFRRRERRTARGSGKGNYGE